MNIYETISAVMTELPAISKDRKNVKQGFMYRGIEDVMNTLQPLLIKHKLFVVPSVISQSREERKTSGGGNLIYSIINMEFVFYAEDGTSVTARVIGEGMDSGDKASNKAMSVAFKYACFQVFCIPTEAMNEPDAKLIDPDGDTPQPSEPLKQSEAQADPQASKKEYLCARCKTPFTGILTKDGKKFTAAEVYTKSKEANGEPLCSKCLKEIANEGADA